MAFSFYGNEQAVSILSKTLSSGKLSHSYLFYGDEGVGKKTLAKQFAQGILCKEDDRPCLICSSCKKIASGNHVDYTEIGGDTTSGKQGFSVDEVRSLIEDAYIKPNEGTHKIFLLKNVESLLASSANTLLKLLEEPPPDVIFLLTAQSRTSVLKTISSRCVPIGVYPVNNEQCLAALSCCLPGSDRQVIETAISLCEGSIGKAIFYADDPIGKKAITISSQVETAVLERNELAFMQSVAELEENNALSLAVFKCFLSRIRIALTDNVNQAGYIDNNFANTVFKANECVEKAKNNLLKNGNKRLTISRLCAEMFSD